MTRFVSTSTKGDKSINQKYVNQTYETMSNFNSNLELIASQIAQLPVREQNRFFRLVLNYIDMTAQKSSLLFPPVGLKETIELCEQIIQLVNDYYSEQDELQLQLLLEEM